MYVEMERGPKRGSVTRVPTEESLCLRERQAQKQSRELSVVFDLRQHKVRLIPKYGTYRFDLQK